MKVYLSGKISGLDYPDVLVKFHYAKMDLYQMGLGLDEPDIKNPCYIRPLFGIKKYWCYMIADIFHLLRCNTIFMLDNWKDSRGAKIELAIAILTKKKIMYQ